MPTDVWIWNIPHSLCKKVQAPADIFFKFEFGLPPAPWKCETSDTQHPFENSLTLRHLKKNEIYNLLFTSLLAIIA